MEKLSYNWDNEFKNYQRFPYSFTALKSCIEADEPVLLADILGDHKNAHIYALIQCFTTIPSVKCIEYLISEGTPLNETFINNPFQCTPQEYLNLRFNTTYKDYMKARSAIYNAINRGKLHTKSKEHISIIMSPSEESQRPTIFGRLGSSIMTPILKAGGLTRK